MSFRNRSCSLTLQPYAGSIFSNFPISVQSWRSVLGASAQNEASIHTLAYRRAQNTTILWSLLYSALVRLNTCHCSLKRMIFMEYRCFTIHLEWWTGPGALQWITGGGLPRLISISSISSWLSSLTCRSPPMTSLMNFVVASLKVSQPYFRSKLQKFSGAIPFRQLWSVWKPKFLTHKRHSKTHK